MCVNSMRVEQYVYICTYCACVRMYVRGQYVCVRMYAHVDSMSLQKAEESIAFRAAGQCGGSVGHASNRLIDCLRITRHGRCL